MPDPREGPAIRSGRPRDSAPFPDNGFPSPSRRLDVARPTLAGLRFLFDEARHVLDAQRDAIDAFDEKAARLLRFDALLLGLVLTAASLMARAGWMGRQLHPFTIGYGLGVACLVVSAVTTVVAYRRLRWNMGLRAESLRRALGYEADEEALLVASLQAYTRAMARNSSTTDHAAKWLDRGLAALLSGIIILAASSTGLWVIATP